ncbi:MAG: haloacid dehalogenase-like hydrolase [Solirubrobacteraceae bacterium]|nr:haloacid dehalogenase-like hydrolase [Solirubrobacteraceae bacterium]
MTPTADRAAVGFDLDMTLVDSRPVSRRALECLVEEHGHDLDVEMLMAAYGLPLSQWLAPGTDSELFRALQQQDVSDVVAMPGAFTAVDAARQAGHRVVVVTAAPSALAATMLQAVGLRVDVLRADVWAAGKVQPLRDERCWAFIGDHADDMQAARDAGTIAIGVSSGTSPPYGADVDLGSLERFPAWLISQEAANARPT